jgi:hypothetical protein
MSSPATRPPDLNPNRQPMRCQGTGRPSQGCAVASAGFRRAPSKARRQSPRTETSPASREKTHQSRRVRVNQDRTAGSRARHLTTVTAEWLPSTCSESRVPRSRRLPSGPSVCRTLHVKADFQLKDGNACGSAFAPTLDHRVNFAGRMDWPFDDAGRHGGKEDNDGLEPGNHGGTAWAR